MFPLQRMVYELQKSSSIKHSTPQVVFPSTLLENKLWILVSWIPDGEIKKRIYKRVLNTVALFPNGMSTTTDITLIQIQSPPLPHLCSSHSLIYTLNSTACSHHLVCSGCVQEKPLLNQRKNYYLLALWEHVSKNIELNLLHSLKSITFVIFVTTFQLLHGMISFQDSYCSRYTKWFYVH